MHCLYGKLDPENGRTKSEEDEECQMSVEPVFGKEGSEEFGKISEESQEEAEHGTDEKHAGYTQLKSDFNIFKRDARRVYA